MESIEIFFIVMIALFLIVFPIAKIIDKFLYRREHKKFVDDGKPIPNIPLMEAHCQTVHTGIALYQMLDCAVCPYREECKKYELRYGHYPNGMKDDRNK